jgi:hypothetical protein
MKLDFPSASAPGARNEAGGPEVGEGAKELLFEGRGGNNQQTVLADGFNRSGIPTASGRGGRQAPQVARVPARSAGHRQCRNPEPTEPEDELTWLRR